MWSHQVLSGLSGQVMPVLVMPVLVMPVLVRSVLVRSVQVLSGLLSRKPTTNPTHNILLSYEQRMISQNLWFHLGVPCHERSPGHVLLVSLPLCYLIQLHLHTSSIVVAIAQPPTCQARSGFSFSTFETSTPSLLRQSVICFPFFYLSHLKPPSSSSKSHRH